MFGQKAPFIYVVRQIYHINIYHMKQKSKRKTNYFLERKIATHSSDPIIEILLLLLCEVAHLSKAQSISD